jgi:hypothetical protein
MGVSLPKNLSSDKGNPMAKNKQSSGINISSGSIQGIISSGNITIKKSTVTIGNHTVSIEKEPDVGELQQLLTEIQRDLAEITAQQDTLRKVSSATPHVAKGAEESIRDAVEKIKPNLKPTEAKSVQQSLSEATNLLSGILDGAKTVAQKATGVGKAVKPIAEKLEPVIERLGVAVLWVAKLWLQG